MLGFKGKKEEFFVLFEESTYAISKGVLVLSQLMEDYSTLPQKMEEMEKLEQEGDEITRTILDKVNKTFATPIDREDIFNLAQNLDNILDGLNNVCEKMLLYKAGQPTPYMHQMVKILEQLSELLQKAFSYLHKLTSKQEEIITFCRKINALETEGDLLYKGGMAELFATLTDPIELIKRKEIYNDLEEIVDLFEDLADLLKGVVLKYA